MPQDGKEVSVVRWYLRLAGMVLALGGTLTSVARAEVGKSLATFEEGPMVTSGQVVFLEPFSLRDHELQGVTYRATDAFQKACQIMLVLKGGVISSEIFAMPILRNVAILKAEKDLLDSFLVQSGIPEEFHPQVREQLLQATDRPAAPRHVGKYAVQTMLIPSDIPLLVLAIASDSAALPLPKPVIKPQIPQ